MRPDLPAITALEAYLRERASQGARMPSRTSKPLEHWEYGVGEIDDDVPFASLLPHHRVFQVHCHCPFLLHDSVLPSGGGLGYFAFDGETVTYLHHSELPGVEAVLARYRASLFERAPELVTELFAAIVLSRRPNHRHAVLASHAALARSHGLVNERFAALEEQVTAPTVLALGDAGWEVAFYSLYGWMHARTTLRHHSVRVSPSFQIRCDSRDVAHDLIEPLEIDY